MHFVTPALKACHEYERRTGERPTRLYLGRREFHWLLEWRAMFPCYISSDEPSSLKKWNGLTVVEVNEDAYLAVS